MAAHVTGNYAAGVRCVAITALTKNLADELGPKGVTANTIHPGIMRAEKTTPEHEAMALRTSSVGKMIGTRCTCRLGRAPATGRVQVTLPNLLGWSRCWPHQKSIAVNGETITAGGGMPFHLLLTAAELANDSATPFAVPLGRIVDSWFADKSELANPCVAPIPVKRRPISKH